MRNGRLMKIKIAKGYSKKSKGNSTDLYGSGVKNMLAVMYRKEIKSLRKNCFNVYERENWLV